MHMFKIHNNSLKFNISRTDTRENVFWYCSIIIGIVKGFLNCKSIFKTLPNYCT